MIGTVTLTGVSVDDRIACTWALHDVDLEIPAGSVVAVTSDPDGSAAEALCDLLTGHRVPFAGEVAVDGRPVRDCRFAIRDTRDASTGERRVTVAGGTVIVAHPTAETLAAADLVVSFDHGRRVDAPLAFAQKSSF